jgi:nucleoside-diphosphate-sugar epimerase
VSWLIPHCIVSLLAGTPPAMTAGEQRWDYLYAADAAAALWRVLATPAAEGVFNLGSGRPVAIREVATRLRDLIDPALPLRLGELPYRPGGTMHLEADPGRLIRATGWQPATGLEDGLAATVAWYRGPSAARGSR